MLNLIYVEAFVAVLEQGGFQQAARNLNRAQPTVSLQLQKLEECVGATLISRNRNQCTATSAGERFYPYAQSLLRLESRARAVATRPSIVVGASSNVGIYVLQPYLKRFIDSIGADDAVEVTIASNPTVATKLERGEVDLAVMEWWDHRPGYAANIWRHEQLTVIVHPEHPWANLQHVAKGQLLEGSWVGGEPGTGTGRLLTKVFGKNLRKLRIVANLGSTEAVKEAVKAGVGVSLVINAAVREEVECGSIVALPVNGVTLEKEIWTIHPESVGNNLLVKGFLDGLAKPLVP